MQRDGLGIGARKIAVSTVGEIKGIERFSNEGWQVRLSVSLHAANDKLRSELVPLNRKFPLKMLIDSIQNYTENTGRQITFEYTLLKGVHHVGSSSSAIGSPFRNIRNPSLLPITTYTSRSSGEMTVREK